jgi:hypothetical protein
MTDMQWATCAMSDLSGLQQMLAKSLTTCTSFNVTKSLESSRTQDLAGPPSGESAKTLRPEKSAEPELSTGTLQILADVEKDEAGRGHIGRQPSTKRISMM